MLTWPMVAVNWPTHGDDFPTDYLTLPDLTISVVMPTFIVGQQHIVCYAHPSISQYV
jgi:hypothetical protein